MVHDPRARRLLLLETTYASGKSSERTRIVEASRSSIIGEIRPGSFFSLFNCHMAPWSPEMLAVCYGCQ